MITYKFIYYKNFSVKTNTTPSKEHFSKKFNLLFNMKSRFFSNETKKWEANLGRLPKNYENLAISS